MVRLLLMGVVWGLCACTPTRVAEFGLRLFVDCDEAGYEGSTIRDEDWQRRHDGGKAMCNRIVESTAATLAGEA